MSKEASNAAKAAEETESFRRDLELVLEDIVYRLHEGTEDGVSLDIQVLVGECQRLSSLLRLDRIPIRWGEYFKREPFRKHLTCGWPGVGEHPWSDLLSEETRTTAVSLCLVVTGPYQDDEEGCFLLAVVNLEEQYEPSIAWQRHSRTWRENVCRRASLMLNRWIRFLGRSFGVGGSQTTSSGLQTGERAPRISREWTAPELTDDERADLPRLSDRHKSVLVAMLARFNAVGPDALSRPTGSTITKAVLAGIGESEPKRIYSEMVKLGWMDNGAHHGGQRGYFLTSRGFHLAQHLHAKALKR